MSAYKISSSLLLDHKSNLASEVALESSREEDLGGHSPPPTKRPRFDIKISQESNSFLNWKLKMKNQTNSDLNENGELICELVQNGVTDLSTDKFAALKEKNCHYKRKALSRHDEEIIRIIGQHLKHLGFK